MREQHESEIRNLENLMKASQDMLQQQVTKYSDQMQRLGELVVLAAFFVWLFILSYRRCSAGCKQAIQQRAQPCAYNETSSRLHQRHKKTFNLNNKNSYRLAKK